VDGMGDKRHQLNLADRSRLIIPPNFAYIVQVKTIESHAVEVAKWLVLDLRPQCKKRQGELRREKCSENRTGLQVRRPPGGEEDVRTLHCTVR